MILAQRLAVLTAFATLFLVGVGVLVRATGSGLGCPDWPTCHGSAIPPGHREALIEFSHRFTAMVVGFLVVAVAILAWKHYRHVPIITWLATATVPLVGIQGILGAITVKRELPPEVVATHLLTAMLVLSCEIAVAVAMYLEDPAHADQLSAAIEAPKRVGSLAFGALAWLAVTMWIGGYMAESGASTACSGWPLCNGSALPAADDHEVTHMLHRYLAGALIAFVIPLVVLAWRQRHELQWGRGFAVLLGSLYLAQVAVGALNVWFTFPDVLTITHTVLAASIWFTLSGAVALTFYAQVREARPHALSKAGAPA
jgi:heme A synthase